MEKQPSFDKIIGPTEELRENLRLVAAEDSRNFNGESLKEYLVEPTAAERQATEEALAYANALARHYGSHKKITSDHVYILQPQGVKHMTGGRLRGAKYNTFEQSIVVDRSFSPAMLAQSVVHEALHASSYFAAQVSEDGTIRLYRCGMEMTGRTGEERYFAHAQEAIIAELSHRFFKDVILRDPAYAKEIERTEAIKQWVIAYLERSDKDEAARARLIAAVKNILILPENKPVYKLMYESSREDKYKMGFFAGYFKQETDAGTIFRERYAEREKFDKALDDIVVRSKGVITDKRILFDKFARAHFTGNYFPLARLVDGALGQGSFRKLAIDLGEIYD